MNKIGLWRGFSLESGSSGQLWSLTVTLGQVFSHPGLSFSLFPQQSKRRNSPSLGFTADDSTRCIWPRKMNSQQMFRVGMWPSREKKTTLNHKVTSPVVSTDPNVLPGELYGEPRWESYQCEIEHSFWDRTLPNTGFPRTLSDTDHLKYWVTEPRAFGSSTDCNFLEAGEQLDMPVLLSVFCAARVQLISSSFIRCILRRGSLCCWIKWSSFHSEYLCLCLNMFPASPPLSNVAFSFSWNLQLLFFFFHLHTMGNSFCGVQ